MIRRARTRLGRLLINRDYALFMVGSFFSATGAWFLVVAIGWLVWELGRSEFLLGVANFANLGPLLILGVFGGVVADRMDRRRLLLISQTAGTLGAAGLALAVANGWGTIPVILGLLLIIGISHAFSWPAWSPFIADLVGPERLRAAVAFNAARFNLTRIVGPAVAGVILAGLGISACLFTALALQLTLLAALVAIRGAHRTPSPTGGAGHWGAALREGLKFAWHARGVREIILTSAVLGTVVLPYIVFLPAYALGILRIGEEGLGLLYTAVGVGAIAGAVSSGTTLVAAHPRRSQAAYASVAGLFLIVFALSTWAPLSGLALALVGLGSVGFLSTANATIQLSVPREVVGRVIGIWVVVNAGTTPVGGLVLGAIGEKLGLAATLAVAGLAATLLSGTHWLKQIRASSLANH